MGTGNNLSKGYAHLIGVGLVVLIIGVFLFAFFALNPAVNTKSDVGQIVSISVASAPSNYPAVTIIMSNAQVFTCPPSTEVYSSNSMVMQPLYMMPLNSTISIVEKYTNNYVISCSVESL